MWRGGDFDRTTGSMPAATIIGASWGVIQGICGRCALGDNGMRSEFGATNGSPMKLRHPLSGCLLCLWMTCTVAAAERIGEKLVALYDFEERAGQILHDRSGMGEPLDLTISSPQAARCRDGKLVIEGPSAIASAGPAAKIASAVKESQELTIEAWLKPAGDAQNGPARIVSLSADPSRRNFTLGQDGKRYDVRLRTVTTGENGTPSLASPEGSLPTDVTHVVYTRSAGGNAAIYIQGNPQATGQIDGGVGNWSDEFRLLLGNEQTGDRPWRGELHLLAIYSRALSTSEIEQNFAAGPNYKAIDYEKLLPPASKRPIDFVSDVQPILRERCFECHCQGSEEGGLNLGIKARAFEGGGHGPVILAGDSAGSRLVHLIAGIEPDKIMPPKDSDPLTSEQIGILRAWIDQGAAWPKEADIADPRLEKAKTHWAFQPLRRVKLPPVSDQQWPQTPIDHFISSALERNRLSPSPPIEADRLVRRISFDLVGLPPDPAIIDEIRALSPHDQQQAIAAYIDRLLASRRYGERWARHWLDVARYADSDGYESDADRPHAWRYRDFVISALNDDMPLDVFLRWQLAGDEFEPQRTEAWAATGFLTAAANTVLPPTHLEEERLRNRYNELDDMLSTIGTGMLGLTLGCARCHDHKYDAISSREYYRLLSAIHSGERQVARLGNNGSREALVFRDFGSAVSPTWLFGRGDFYDRDQNVRLGFLEVLSGNRSSEDYWNAARKDAKRSDTTYQRKALALWVTDVDEGAGALAARVIVNRVWQHHFGEGLVRTVSDFGVRSQPPTHPELLEWLVHDFVSHGWQLKRLHRLILNSAAYQQGSAFDSQRKKIDPENRLLWRRPPLRLQAEALRDAMLAVSGTLNLQAYGPAFKPPIDSEAMVARNTKSPYPADARDDFSTRRRSVYMFHKRVVPYPLLAAFDRPDAQQACGRRDETTVAPQALALLNDDFVRARAVDFAQHLLAEASEDEQIVERALTLALSRQPTEMERSASLEFLAAQQLERQSRAPDKPAAEIRQAAVADYCQTLFGLSEFLYID